MQPPDPAYHLPVLGPEAVSRWLGAPDGVYVDGTLGGGGHARALLARLGPGGRLVGLDRDPDALAANRDLAGDPRVRLVQGDFGYLPAVLARLGIGPVDGVLLDLGVSSHQLDEGTRGFSFLRDGPLDMRMDPGSGQPASAFVNRAPVAELARVIRAYGEEPRAGRVARAIDRERRRKPLETTGELARVVEKALGRRGAKHPATRTFQALRIAVNGELDALERFLDALDRVLAPGGRVVVISYHSLEDRLVKRALRDAEPRCRCPARALRCTCGTPGWLRPLERRAVRPGPDEVERNPRARSARLRAAERLPDAPPDGERHGGTP